MIIRRKLPKEPQSIVVYSDSDWAGEKDRRSISGNVIMFGGDIISYKSKKQTLIALSTFEAELIAMVSATQQALYIKNLLKFFRLKTEPEVKVLVDNQAVINCFKKKEATKRSKYIDIRYLYMLQKHQRSDIKVSYVKSEDNIADILTKNVSRKAFETLSERMIGESMN